MPSIEQVYIETQELEPDDVRVLREVLENDQAVSKISERLHFEESVSGNSWLVGLTISITVVVVGKGLEVAKDLLMEFRKSRSEQYDVETIYDHNGKPAFTFKKKKIPK